MYARSTQRVSWSFGLVFTALIGCSGDATAPVAETDTPPLFGFGNGAPSGAHYNLNMIGVPESKSADMTGNNGHRMFVRLQGRTRVLLCQSGVSVGCEDVEGYRVLDANGTDGEASFALPHPDPEGDGTTIYSVYVRALGQPGGRATNTTCGMGAGDDGVLGTADDEEVCSVYQLELERKKGRSRFENVSREMLFVWTDLDGDGKLDRVALFDDDLIGYFWDYDNDGLRLAQFRFYPCSTTVADDGTVTDNCLS